jgi:hypothetical protein
VNQRDQQPGQGAPAPQQPQYPSYPYPYPTYPYYGYAPWPGPAAASVLPPTPAERPAAPGRARLANVVLAVVMAVATAGALVLAAVAPSLAQHAPSPAREGFAQVYNQQLADDSAHWDVGQGCVFDQGGLHATLQARPTLCAFLPSKSGDLTGSGFSLTTTVGPAAAVAGVQEPCLLLSSGSQAFSLAFDQQGEYVFEMNPSQPCELTTNQGLLPQTQAWHAGGETPNQITVVYLPAGGTITVYVNSQEVVSNGWQLSGQNQISLGATGGGEAIFTSFALYSGSASSSRA